MDSNIGANLGTELVTIIAGEEKRKFVVHKQLLCRRVPYFSRAFAAGGFKESLELSMDMPEDDAKTFELFLHWLYGDGVPHQTKDTDFDLLVNLYIFAEKLCMNEVANKTMDVLRCGPYDEYPRMTPARTEKMWNNTSPKSPLRKLCIHALLSQMCDYKEPQKENEGPGFLTKSSLHSLWGVFKGNCDIYAEFFIEAQKLSACNLPEAPFCYDEDDDWACLFHRHLDGEECHLIQGSLQYLRY